VVADSADLHNFASLVVPVSKNVNGVLWHLPIFRKRVLLFADTIVDNFAPNLNSKFEAAEWHVVARNRAGKPAFVVLWKNMRKNFRKFAKIFRKKQPTHRLSSLGWCLASENRSRLDPSIPHQVGFRSTKYVSYKSDKNSTQPLI
jgi:hypothetical protein